MYVERGGEQVFRGPFLQSGTDYRAFLVRADRDRLATLAERTFERPTGGAVRVRPLGDTVLVSFASIARITSLDPEHARHGGMPETDLVFWVPLEVTCGDERFVAWFVPYIFVDAPAAMATGREHYGFPKSVGAIHVPPVGSDAPHAVDTLVLERFGVATTTRPMRLLEVRKGGPGPSTTAQLLALSELFGVTTGALAGSLKAVFTRDLPVLFLRQLRDVASPADAVFTEVLVASTRTRTVRSAGLLRDGHTLHLANAASHPIGADLGLAADTPVAAAFHMDFDFEMGLGRTLWRSGGQPLRVAEAGGGSVGAAAAPAPPRRERVAVLGGGMGALSAVYAITDQPGWEDRYDLTVYQMGWRLGGKGASGRNADAGQRIEEHGLHIWFGFYENAFRMMRRCYAEAGRAPGTPLATWREAFRPHSRFVVQEEVDGEWIPWDTDYPENDALPGDPSPELTPTDLARQLARWGGALLEDALEQTKARGRSRVGAAAVAALAGAARLLLQATLRAIDDPGARDSVALAQVTATRRKLQALLETEVERDTLLRRAWIGVDWVVTNLHGMIRDGVLEHGFDVIDGWDYQAWLRHHGASEMTVRSAPVRAGYDLVFGFRDGDSTKPDFAAGVGLYGLLRMFFTYKGAVAWKMQGGMGDVVFAPMYEVLKRRGVKFAFFHKVEELSVAGDRVDAIRIARQATPKGDYHPLVDVNGLPCWPDRPLYDQLVEDVRGVDLESGWNGHAPVERIVLRDGVDFDRVILGIPVGALRKVCAPLVAARKEWRDMVENVATVCTHAFQLWLTPDLAGLGWTAPGAPPVLGAYVEPTDTWADMTHLAPLEAWPEAPGHIAYFCGPMPTPAEYPPETDTDFPRRERARAMAMARTFLDRDVGRLWPAAVDARGFRDTLLVDPDGRPPEARFARQLFKGNVEPTDRYTQSRAGTMRYRLRADGSGFANLLLAGDWVDNGFNGACIESTVMSGLQCARALTGADIPVYGESPRLRPAGRPAGNGRRDVVEWVAAGK